MCHTATIREWLQNLFVAECAAPLQPYDKETINNCSALRLSTALDLPVCQSDSLSNVVCTPCIKKFEYLEAFRSLAKHNYQKQVSKEQFHPSIGSGSSPVRPVHKNRTKDTSGTGASPCTVSSRLSAKRITLGKRLAFTPVQSMQTQT